MCCLMEYVQLSLFHVVVLQFWDKWNELCVGISNLFS